MPDCDPQFTWVTATIGYMNSQFSAYALSEEHEALRESVRQLAEDKIAPYAAEVDQQARFPHEAQDALVRADLHAVHIPEAAPELTRSRR